MSQYYPVNIWQISPGYRIVPDVYITGYRIVLSGFGKSLTTSKILAMISLN